ncbi:MAG: hypothetical protein ACPHSF_06060, partial [Flavobacteriales bacterium]
FESGVRAHPLICPAELFSTLYTNDRQAWESYLRGPQGLNRTYWEKIADHAVGRNLETHDKLLPLGIHADAAPFCKTESVFTLAWNGVCGDGDTLATRLVSTIVRKSEMCEAVMNTIFSRFAWGMNVLHSGYWPEKDWAGQRHPKAGTAVADGWCGCVTQCRGDWEWFCDWLKFPRWNEAGPMCFLCHASNLPGPMSWTNRDGAWVGDFRNHEDFIRDQFIDGGRPCALFSIRSLRIEGCMVDVLHALDQGVSSHVHGNVLWEIAMSKRLTQEEAVSWLQSEIVAWYKRKHNKEHARIQGKLTVQRVKTSGDWPKLKAKAAATRRLTEFVLQLAETHNSGSEHDQKRLGVAQLLNEYYTLIHAEGRWFSTFALDRIPRVVYTFHGLYAALSAEALRLRVRAWKFIPKFHLFAHIAHPEILKLGNPRFYWCYQDEDNQRNMASICASAHMDNLAQVSLHKWVILTFTLRRQQAS